MIRWIVGLVLIGCLTGCSGGDRPEPEPKGNRPEVSDAPKGAIPPGDQRDAR